MAGKLNNYLQNSSSKVISSGEPEHFSKYFL